MLCNYDTRVRYKIDEYFGWGLLESVHLPVAFYRSWDVLAANYKLTII